MPSSSKAPAPQPPSTRMSLRSFRNVPQVPMDTSSSDDSCDSFGSDGGYANTRNSLKLVKRMVNKAKVFEATSEEDSCSGLEDNDFSSRMSAMHVEPRRSGRKSRILKVAMKFPNKKTVIQRKRPVSEPLVKPRQPKETVSDEGENFLVQRALSIQQNKAMLAKLMADLSKVPALKTPRTYRKFRPMRPKWCSDRDIPVLTRSRSLVDGPPRLPSEDEEEVFEDRLMRRNRYYEEVDETAQPRQPRRNGALTIQHIVHPVEEVTESELSRICYNVREKVYNRASGSTCHQCRQKTIDTKTNCRNQECVGVRGQFCGPCLRNRYGEDVRDALLQPDWLCPPCRGICNCSFCRARQGRCATGVLVYQAKHQGYDHVHAYLKSLNKKLEEDQ